MSIEWYNWAGYVGMLLLVLAFALLQTHKLRGNGLIYQVLNILGSIGMILWVVFGHFNLPILVMSVVWLLIGIYGIVYNGRRRQDARQV